VILILSFRPEQERQRSSLCHSDRSRNAGAIFTLSFRPEQERRRDLHFVIPTGAGAPATAEWRNPLLACATTACHFELHELRAVTFSLSLRDPHSVIPTGAGAPAIFTLSFRPEQERQRRRSGGTCCPPAPPPLCHPEPRKPHRR
jgi:hypothetical protein